MLQTDPEKRILLEAIPSHPIVQVTCPSRYIEFGTTKNTTADLIRQLDEIHMPNPWQNEIKFDVEILENMQILGWGDTKQIQKILLMDNLRKNSQRNSQKICTTRMDRFIYL